MYRFSRWGGPVLGAAMLAVTTLLAQDAATDVKVKAVTIAELDAAIKQQKGKVVVVDFWGLT